MLTLELKNGRKLNIMASQLDKILEIYGTDLIINVSIKIEKK